MKEERAPLPFCRTGIVKYAHTHTHTLFITSFSTHTHAHTHTRSLSSLSFKHAEDNTLFLFLRFYNIRSFVLLFFSKRLSSLEASTVSTVSSTNGKEQFVLNTKNWEKSHLSLLQEFTNTKEQKLNCWWSSSLKFIWVVQDNRRKIEEQWDRSPTPTLWYLRYS